MNENPLGRFSKGAAILLALRDLRPGQAYRMADSRLADIEVPANHLDRQTPEFLARYFHARLPFYATLDRIEDKAAWEIYRPKASISE